VQHETLAVAGVEFGQKLSSFGTSLNIHLERGFSALMAAIFIYIFVKFLRGKRGREELDGPECEFAKFCVSCKL
jgi:hypothetical protein